MIGGDFIRSWWPVAAAIFGIGVAWATYGQQVDQNTKHREAVKGLPEQVQIIAAGNLYRDCIEDGTPREICRCEREELLKEEPNFRRCEYIAERLIRSGHAERIQTVLPDSADERRGSNP